MRLAPGKGWRLSLLAAAIPALVLSSSAVAGVMAEEATAPRATASAAPVRGAWLWVGFSELLRYSDTVGTIIVGDVGIVDAAVIDENSVVLTALETGRTNVIVLGQQGGVLAQLSVRVREQRPPAAIVYRGVDRSVVNCDPRCAPATEAALEGAVE